jgi:hypothetical protein
MEKVMHSVPNQTQILAFVVFELHERLAGELLSSSPGHRNVHVAAHLANALHVQALEALGGQSFNPGKAQKAIAEVDKKLGTNFVNEFLELSENLRSMAANEANSSPTQMRRPRPLSEDDF